jgi:hypothetical protein
MDKETHKHRSLIPMFSKTDVKTIVFAAVGVFAAGLVMNALRGVGVVKNAINGFDS